MSTAKQYKSATSFRVALESRLNKSAVESGTDVQRLRREVAFDRLLARLFHDSSKSTWTLKGGYAMELRMDIARATRDIDLSLTQPASGGHTSLKAEMYRDLLQEAAEKDLGDFFVYLIEGATLDLDGPPYGGFRYPVEAKMDGRTFARFHLDIGIGDVALEPLEAVKSKEWLSFAGIYDGAFRAISKEQQFAEKYHAYTLPRIERPNSRVKDLIDLVLLITSGDLDILRTNDALVKTFGRRKTHELPPTVPLPPENWQQSFEAMAQDCQINKDMLMAVETVSKFMQLLA